jgi:hypothetical protein
LLAGPTARRESRGRLEQFNEAGLDLDAQPWLRDSLADQLFEAPEGPKLLAGFVSCSLCYQAVEVCFGSSTLGQSAKGAEATNCEKGESSFH